MATHFKDEQTFKDRFCRFHRGLITRGLAEDTCGACLMNVFSEKGISLLDPENVTLYPAGNLGMLIRMIGSERWQVIRDDPDAIRCMIEKINFFSEVQTCGVLDDTDELPFSL